MKEFGTFLTEIVRWDHHLYVDMMLKMCNILASSHLNIPFFDCKGKIMKKERKEKKQLTEYI